MKAIEIPYTSIEEQRKIGDYLESLDHLITLHQRMLISLEIFTYKDIQRNTYEISVLNLCSGSDCWFIMGFGKRQHKFSFFIFESRTSVSKSLFKWVEIDFLQFLRNCRFCFFNRKEMIIT